MHPVHIGIDDGGDDAMTKIHRGIERGVDGGLRRIRQQDDGGRIEFLRGGEDLAAALLNLLRPSAVLCAVALVAAGHGLVIYNTTLSALAVALLVLSLARPAPEPE